MDLLVFGHAGHRVLAFPTSRGSYHEWEDRQMPAVLGEQLQTGQLQLFCVSSADDASWYDETIPVHERAEWQARYDACLTDEVLPYMASVNADPFLITTGASFGGYHALNFAMRHPELVSRALSMSGLPDIKRLTGGWSDDAVYFQNPAEFIRHEHDEEPPRGAAANGHHTRRRPRRLALRQQRRVFRCALGPGASAMRCGSGTAGRTTGPTGSRCCSYISRDTTKARRGTHMTTPIP